MLLKRSISHAVTAASVGLVVMLAGFATSAKAGTYEVPFCDRSASTSTASWTHSSTAGSPPPFYSDDSCSMWRVYRRFEIWTVPAGASDDWTFDAPAGTYISRLDMYQNAQPRSAGAMVAIYSWQEDGSRTQTAAARPGGGLFDDTYYFPLTGSKVVKLRNSLMCQDGASCPGLDPSNHYGNEDYFYGATVHLVDPSLPEFQTVSGSGWKPEPADGLDTIDYTASDTGAGVKEAKLLVDGVLQSTHPGTCVAERLVPCNLNASGSFTLDTTRLSEGQHAVELRLVDGSMNEQTKQLTIAVRRPPTAIGSTAGGNPVAITNASWSGSDAPAVGDHLHGSPGTWTGSGLSFSYQWQRCDANGTACIPIPGATTLDYLPTSADVGHALQFCVTASNSGGSSTSCSAPTAPVVAAHAGAGSTTPSSADPVERPGDPTKAISGASSTTTAADRGQPNGSPASDKAVLTVMSNSRTATKRVKFGARVLIGGRLVGPDRAPVANAILEIQTKTAVAGSSVANAGRVVTGSDGRFTYVAPAGPSRVIRFAYRSHSADTAFADTSDVTLLVSAGVTIKATPTRVPNRHATVFTGRLLGKPISKRGVVVDLQVFFRHKWRTFGAPRTNRLGKYKFRYRFMAGAATWKFRARVRRESSYPYLEGYSRRTVKVKVVN